MSHIRDERRGIWVFGNFFLAENKNAVTLARLCRVVRMLAIFDLFLLLPAVPF
jgi:hypothetical protein